jgi:hypothetical protein
MGRTRKPPKIALPEGTATEAAEGESSMWYGDEDTGNFDTGSANTGTLASPEFVPGGNSTLQFDYLLDGESADGATSSYDQLWLDYSTDGGDNWSVWAQLEDQEGSFRTRTVDLSAFDDISIRIRFRFDSYDSANNDFPGAYIDNVLMY